MFKKDSYIIGMIIALPLPILFYFLIPFFVEIIPEKNGMLPLAGIVFNILLFRYYMLNAKLEKTGKGIILLVFIQLFSFFTFFY